MGEIGTSLAKSICWLSTTESNRQKTLSKKPCQNKSSFGVLVTANELKFWAIQDDGRRQAKLEV
jgi:hypothetical protein